jgi:hypothetical protein
LVTANIFGGNPGLSVAKCSETGVNGLVLAELLREGQPPSPELPEIAFHPGNLEDI